MASNTDQIDKVSRYSGLGSLSESAANAAFGINHRGVGNPIPYNTDNQGLTFFTKPNLNLSTDNLMQDRVLTPLIFGPDSAQAHELTWQRWARVSLDPRGAFERGVTSPRLVDHQNPFIALLTNNLLSLNGWPDPIVNYFTSKEGVQKEVWSMVDDVANNYQPFDLTGNFRSIAGDPITLLFECWRRYSARVYEGVMMPYPESIVENEIDYQTRIYRFVLDPSRRFVQKVAACGAAFPTSSSIGQAMNYTSDTPFSQESAQQISIPFHCVGAIYQDPILFQEFNDLVGFFNPNMQTLEQRLSNLVQLQPSELLRFNYYGYPYVDPRSQELQWWVKPEDYNQLLAGTS